MTKLLYPNQTIDFSFSRCDEYGPAYILITNESAEVNAMQNFFMTMKGDYIGYPEDGGVLYDYLQRPIDGEVINQIKQSVTAAIENRFRNFKVPRVDVLHDPSRGVIRITVFLIDYLRKITLERSFGFRVSGGGGL